MYRNKTIAVIIPCYNEESQIGPVIETMPDIVDTIVIVDDVSKDKTIKVVEAHQKDNPKIILLKHRENQGVGGAIATGFKWARDNEVDIAAVMDGDGQMDPNDLPALLTPIAEGKADYTKGNRLISGEAYRSMPKIRYFGNSVLSLLTKIASGYWHITDSQTGYRAINSKALHTLDWDNTYKRYGQPNDLLVKLNIYNFRVQDVEIKPLYNVGEKSTLKVRKVIFTISWLLIRLFSYRMKEKYIIRDFHPLIFFYFSGFSLLSLSIPLFIRIIYFWIKFSHIPSINFLSWMFATITGFQFIFFAMWFDMEYNKNLR